MLGRGKSKPLALPAQAFLHEAGCKTPDAEPEWYETEDRGHFERVCSCTVEHYYQISKPVEPAVDVGAHRHVPGCLATAVVKVDEVSRERFTRCAACETSTHYVDTSRMRPEDLAGLVL